MKNEKRHSKSILFTFVLTLILSNVFTFTNTISDFQEPFSPIYLAEENIPKTNDETEIQPLTDLDDIITKIES